jgi:hypothetical protein
MPPDIVDEATAATHEAIFPRGISMACCEMDGK